MYLFKLAIRNALRNVRRSLLTAGTVVVGVALFVFASSFMGGMIDQLLKETTLYIGHVRVADSDWIDREAMQPLYEYLPDADAVVRSVVRQPGVQAAYPVISSGVGIAVGDGELGEVFGQVHGAPLAWLDQVDMGNKLQSGRLPTAEGELLMGARLVRKADAELGDEVILFGQTQDGALSPIRGTLVGVVHTGSPITDRTVYTSLAAMQSMVDLGPGAIEVIVYLDDMQRAEEAAADIRRAGDLEGATVQAWTSRSPYNQIVPMMGAMDLLIGGALIFLTALAIWNTMTMSVLERTSEIGVLRAMGMSRWSSVGLFVVEAAVIAVLGGVIGVLVGMGPSLYMETYGVTYGEDLIDSMGTDYAMSTTLYADFTATIAVKGVVLGILMAVVGSFVPALRAARVQPVEAMRHGR